jgi:hypothetical protein
MGIDTVIDYPCIPKDILTTAGILARLKSRLQAETVLKVYREHGDYRPTGEIGFEVVRRSADGTETADTLIVAEVLEEAAVLDEVADHCVGCPVNRTNMSFGCMHTINFPISEVAEIWLLGQLPSAESPLVHILNQGIETYDYDGESARQLRQQAGVFFEAVDSLGRPYVEHDLIVTTDMLFEMMFLVGAIQLGHAAMLMLFLNAIPRENVTPDELFWLLNGTASSDLPQQFPFQMRYAADDDATITDLKSFLHALYLAYTQQVAVLVDV